MEKEEVIYLIQEKIKSAKRPVIFYDTDSDGTMSYFQLRKLNPSLKGYPIKKSKDDQLESVSRIGRTNDLVLFFDTPHLEVEAIEILSHKPLIWVDHHVGNNQELIEEHNITHLNPLNYDSEDSRPSCYWAYKIANTKENLPLVSLGTVADFYLLDIILELKEDYPQEFNLLFNLDDDKKKELLEFIKSTPYNQKQEERSNWIRELSFTTTVGVLKMFFDYIYKLESHKIEPVVKSLSSMSVGDIISEISAEKEFPFIEFAKFKKELNIHLKKATKLNQNNLIAFYNHSGEISFNRQICEECLFRLPKVEVVISTYEKEDSEMVSCSIRSKQLPIQQLLVDELKKVKGFGGGHDLACGAAVAKKDFAKFKRQFIEKVEEKITQHHQLK